MVKEKFYASLEELANSGYFDTFDNVKNRLGVRLYSQETNLEGLPHMSLAGGITAGYFVDLSGLVDEDDGGCTTARVSNTMLQNWGLSVEDLDKIAVESMSNRHPLLCQKLTTLLMIDDDTAEDIMVLTNVDFMFGASAILYPGMLKNLAEEAGANLVVLPSSIHEVLLVPDSEKYKGIAESDMVREINRMCVSQVDRLSDEIFYYDRDKDELRVY